MEKNRIIFVSTSFVVCLFLGFMFNVFNSSKCANSLLQVNVDALCQSNGEANESSSDAIKDHRQNFVTTTTTTETGYKQVTIISCEPMLKAVCVFHGKVEVNYDLSGKIISAGKYGNNGSQQNINIEEK